MHATASTSESLPVRRAPGRTGWARSARAILARPRLWSTALRQAGRMARPRWWRRPPFVPLPDRAYIAFRLETQYGRAGAPAPGDLVTYLEWCRDEQAAIAAERRSGHR